MRESKAKRDLRVKKILEKLDEVYGTEKIIYLDHNNAWQLLFAVIMSAQTTDAAVNKATPALFNKYPTLEDFAKADLKDVESLIKTIGLYKSKARNLITTANILVDKYNSEVPSDIDELTSLAGVGRKTANVIRGGIYNIPSIVVDTHVKRISNKLGLVKSEDPVKIEYELMEVLPKDHWITWNTNIIALGRSICIARREKCSECFLNEYCPSCKKDK